VEFSKRALPHLVPHKVGGSEETHSGEGKRDADCEACPSQVIGCSIVSHYSSEMWIIVNQLVKSQLYILMGWMNLVFVWGFLWTDMAGEITFFVLESRSRIANALSFLWLGF
jgi:hypothetical protein